MSCFFRHRWGKWRDPEFRNIHITTAFDLKGFKRRVLMQKRTCKGCGEVEYKDIGRIQ